jgi:hypothetical protein
LEHYVYKRCSPAYALLATYFISAFWHGFYPGYVAVQRALRGCVFTVDVRAPDITCSS